MPNKIRISEIHSDEEYFSDCCDIRSFAVEMTPKLIDRITALSKAVELAGAYYIAEFHYAGRWSTLDQSTLNDSAIPMELAGSTSMSVDIDMLHVSATEFWWTCVFKHTNLDMTTDRFKIYWK